MNPEATEPPAVVPEPEVTPEPKEPAPEEEKTAKPEGKEGGEETPTEEEEPKPEAEKHKRAGGWQRKIDRLERQNQQLVDQLAAQRPGLQTPATSSGKEKTAEEKAEEYVDGLVERKLAAREAQRQQQTHQATFQQRAAEVRAANPDFDDVVMSAEVPISRALQEVILTSESGPAIMYQLAKSPAELARISALPPLEAAREVGRLEAKLASSTATPKTARPKSALAPITPVTARGPTNVKRPEEMSYEEYNAWRDGQRKR